MTILSCASYWEVEAGESQASSHPNIGTPWPPPAVPPFLAYQYLRLNRCQACANGRTDLQGIPKHEGGLEMVAPACRFKALQSSERGAQMVTPGQVDTPGT